jgi:hypothetical protein
VGRPATGWPAIFRYSVICGQAQIVGLLPVFGAFSISSNMRGLSLLCPLDSIAIGPHSSAWLLPVVVDARRRLRPAEAVRNLTALNDWRVRCGTCCTRTRSFTPTS